MFESQPASQADLRLIAGQRSCATGSHQLRHARRQRFLLNRLQIQAGIFRRAMRVSRQECIFPKTFDPDLHAVEFDRAAASPADDSLSYRDRDA